MLGDIFDKKLSVEALTHKTPEVVGKHDEHRLRGAVLHAPRQLVEGQHTLEGHRCCSRSIRSACLPLRHRLLYRLHHAARFGFEEGRVGLDGDELKALVDHLAGIGC